MPAKDVYHDTVKNALLKDGWTITDDPLTLQWGTKTYFVDVGAENLLAAKKDTRKIAVEIKSFIGHSETADLQHALGQYVLYHNILEELDPERILFLAVPRGAYLNIFNEAIGRLVIEKNALKLIVFDKEQEVIEKWIE